MLPWRSAVGPSIPAGKSSSEVWGGVGRGCGGPCGRDRRTAAGDGQGAGGGELSLTQFEQEGEGNEGERRAQG